MSSKRLLTIGENLRRVRKQRLISMQELADHCNVDKSTIYRIEKGLLNPTILILLNICEVLECEITEITKIKLGAAED